MDRKRLFVFVLIVFLIGSVASTMGCLDSPEQTVEDFYNAIEMEDEEAIEEALHENSPLQILFVDFIGLWDIEDVEVEEKSVEEIAEEQVVLSMFEDPKEIEEYIEMALEEAGLAEEDDEFAVVEVTLTLDGEEAVFTHVLVEDEGEWKIFV
ncbi:hypothetical protein AMET1_1355 [Methanonatronarchaeum thermophilum]|uniref:DUF4878 domain-containing protein n=1 Tax=Methanonatronarchaeum thermophilum TaxID=1927129 RepID=A0A1Y3GAJ7_9EURY|nr:hypothetical protein [Methanonatronarchaeum thermophilum]OUJ18439.1 hypothetical protein AMET1_1355 [Methanonatronarchaeum thermophilum]